MNTMDKDSAVIGQYATANKKKSYLFGNLKFSEDDYGLYLKIPGQPLEQALCFYYPEIILHDSSLEETLPYTFVEKFIRYDRWVIHKPGTENEVMMIDSRSGVLRNFSGLHLDFVKKLASFYDSLDSYLRKNNIKVHDLTEKV
jgi:hypothetical protein